MKLDLLTMGKAFSPNLVSKALHTFDKATVVIVSASWGVAFILFLLALYTINLSVAAKRQVVEATALDPILPKIESRVPDGKEVSPLVDRLIKRFPRIGFTLSNDRSLTVFSSDVSLFREWLTVLSYIDTISPQYRWEFKSFCVGMACSGSVPMKAVLTPHKVTFSIPAKKTE